MTPEQAEQELAAIAKAFFRETSDPRAERWGVAVTTSSRIPAPVRAPVAGFLAVLGSLTGWYW